MQERHLYKIFQYLFQHVFCVEHSVPEERIADVAPGCFLHWLRIKNGLFDVAGVLEKTGLSQEVWDKAWEVLESQEGPAYLMRWWYFICLGNRPAPKHELSSVHCILLLTWKDGTITPISNLVLRDMLINDKDFTDGHVATLLNNHVHDTFIGSVVERGLDGLHDDGKDYRGTTPADPYGVFCGIVIKALNEGMASGPIDPQYQKPVLDYLRLAQALIRPPTPPHIQAAIRTTQQNGAALAKGGWDTPG